MAKNKKRKSSRFQTYHSVFLVFIVICLAVSAFSFQYYRNLYATIRGESKSYLQEVSRQIGKNLNRIFADNLAMLKVMGAAMENTDVVDFDELQHLLKTQKGYWDYDNILLVGENGKTYDISSGKTTFLTFDNSMRTDLLNGQSAMATTQIVDNKEYIIFAVPLSNVKIKGEKIISLAASYNPSALDQVLSMTSFDDQAYSQIITKSGAVVTRSSSPFAIKSGYNMFSTLENADLDQGVTIDQMKTEIVNDVENQISFSLDGMSRYMVYSPIQPDEWYLLTFVPFHAVNAKSEMLLQSTLLICGVIVITFCALVAALLYVFTANRKKLERIAYVDEVTGGNSMQKFYELAREALNSEDEIRYALLYTNFESFKVLNAQLGRKTCDEILRHFNIYSSRVLSDKECIGRVIADNFCILIRYEGEAALVDRLEKCDVEANKYIEGLGVPWAMPHTEFGIYVIENLNLPFPEMIDRAKLALKESTHHSTSKLRYAFYDDTSRRQLFREKQLSDMMASALENKEFQLYLQPKYHLPEEKIGGAEALVRWVSTTEGMIFPNEFIPLFEKNGFIVQVDLWIFQEVCRTMRSWLDRGLKPVKVSVNCSRIHFKDPFFLVSYINIAEEYGIKKELIEIELTESIVFGNTEQLTKIIQEIRSAGFGCSMDDFGSGYSSLNLIQSIPVDTLKIDGIFFLNASTSPDRTEAVVGSIIQMARSLSLTTVAEGVESREHVEMLKRVGCDYIQGYVFAKPMTVESFEELSFGYTKT